MEVKKGYKAQLKFILISPFKIRRIANQVRKKPYNEAIAILESLPHKGARILKKVIKSAAANAIYIKELQINEGPRMKRIWPRARRRADILLKRFSHVFVVMDEIG
jgi:large subunit ribosomal protein L22